jgi:hypothetical protein
VQHADWMAEQRRQADARGEYSFTLDLWAADIDERRLARPECAISRCPANQGSAGVGHPVRSPEFNPEASKREAGLLHFSVPSCTV